MCGGSPDVEDSPEAKAIADVAMLKYNDYIETYFDAENRMMGNVDRINSGSQRTQVNRDATNNVNSQFVSAINSNARAMAANNVDVNSGKFKGALAEGTSKQSQAEVEAGSKANVGQTERYVDGLKAVSAIGAGKEADALTGMSEASQSAQSYAFQEAQSKLSDKQMIGETAGIAAGALTAHYTNPYSQSGKSTTKGIPGSNAEDYSNSAISAWSNG